MFQFLLLLVLFGTVDSCLWLPQQPSSKLTLLCTVRIVHLVPPIFLLSIYAAESVWNSWLSSNNATLGGRCSMVNRKSDVGSLWLFAWFMLCCPINSEDHFTIVKLYCNIIYIQWHRKWKWERILKRQLLIYYFRLIFNFKVLLFWIFLRAKWISGLRRFLPANGVFMLWQHSWP